MKKKAIYKVLFYNQDKIYEIYAHDVHQSSMLGFIEIEGLIFGERSNLLVDPAEEKLQAEFSGVERSYIPMNVVIRIDKVTREGTNKILPAGHSNNVTPFPASAFTPQKKND